MLAPDSKTLRSWERISWNNCSLVSEGSLDRVVSKPFSNGLLVADREQRLSALVLSVWPALRSGHADREYRVGFGGERIGGAAARYANRADCAGMIPSERALPGVRLGDRYAMPRREIRQRGASQRVMHAAAGNDQRRFGACQCSGSIGELRCIRRGGVASSNAEAAAARFLSGS